MKGRVKMCEENQNKNCLILFLSTYKFVDVEWPYYGTKYEIGGIQTPDAPTKFFLNHLKDKGEKIDKILCITSQKTNEKSVKKKEPNKVYDSAFEDYEKMLNKYCKNKNLDVPELVKLNFDYDFEKDKPIKDTDIYRNLCESIVDELSEGDYIYIDYTSGIRDTSLLIILMIRYLEYTGIKCQGMIYSYYDNDDKEKNRIIDIKSTYDLFELLNGVNEFASFGKSKSLSNYYKNICKGKEENYKEISELIEVMNKFSDIMSLCIVEDVDTIIDELNEKISEVKKLKVEKDLSDDQNKLMVYMFINLIKEIEKKFYLGNNEKLTYINLIKWCLDNELIQQALTLYVEKMPEYYEECGFYNKHDKSLECSAKDDAMKIFYTTLFKSIYDTDNTKNELEEFKSIIRENKLYIAKFRNQKHYLRKYNSKFQKAMEELYNIMDKKYVYNQKKIKVYNKKDLYEFNKVVPLNEERFVNWIDNQKELLLYLLEIPYESKSTIKHNRETKHNPETYDKKIKSINVLEETRINPTWCELPLDDLIILMQDYLYFKIMRNQINHAQKSDLTSTVEAYFEGIGYSMNIKIDNIKNIMKKSIENIEQIEKNKRDFDIF